MSQCLPAAWCLGGPAGAQWSSFSSSQCQGKVPGSASGTLSYYLVPGQCWGKCQCLEGPSASVQVCRCWFQFQFPAGGSGVRVAPAPHSCSLPRTVPAPAPSDGPIFRTIPGHGARAMLDLDPGSHQGSQFTRRVPSASWRRSHFPLPGGASPHSQ